MQGSAQKESWFLAASLFVLLGAVVFWQSREVVVTGRVGLRSWDGTVSVPDSSQAMIFDRSALVTQLTQRLVASRDDLGKAKVEVERAREKWQEKSAIREEALRILRVAERANATDLEACRERHAQAAAAADAAFAELENYARRLEGTKDPAMLLDGLSGALAIAEPDPTGAFTLRARVWHAPVLVAVGGEPGARQAWLVPLDSPWGGQVSVDLSNTNLVTEEQLRSFLGLPVLRRDKSGTNVARGNHDG